MGFDATTATQGVTEATGAMLLLHASNQALIEASIAPSDSPWYAVLNGELGQVEELVVAWRRNGYLYFQQEILAEIISCGQAFLDAQAGIDADFDRLQGGLDPALQGKIAAALTALEAPVAGLTEASAGYGAKLNAYDAALGKPLKAMLDSAAKIQAEAQDIAAEIAAINAKVADLKKQVIADRKAIAKAKAAEKRGVAETIFGIVLAPFTGGVSLILAGIGVGTIADAEKQVKSLESTIATAQSNIAADQTKLTQDQRQIATLGGLTMSVEIAISDVETTTKALDALQVSWDVLAGALKGAASDVEKAATLQDALSAGVMFDAACIAWKEVIAFCESLAGNAAPVPQRVQIG